MVKCSECGYLAIRNKHTWNLDESGRDYRNAGNLPLIYDDIGRNQHHIHEQQPICFARAHDLITEFDKGTKQQNNTLSALNVLIKDRDCTEYTDWQQGFTPKEHREMVDRQNLLKWQAEREDADKRFRLESANDDRKWQSKQQVRLAIIAGFFVIIGAIIGSVIVILR